MNYRAWLAATVLVAREAGDELRSWADEPRVGEVEDGPQVAQPVLHRRAGEGEPRPGGDAAQLDGGLVGRVLDGLRLVEHKITPTDTDLTAPVTALRNAGAKVILLTTTPPQAASAVSVAAASGFDATFLGSSPSFSPQLLAGPAQAALEKSLLVASSVAPFSADSPGVRQVRQAFTSKYPGQPQTAFVMYGYAQGQIMAQILESACRGGALTRSGLLNALHGLSTVDTQGLIAPLDYSKPGGIPARQIYLLRPDAATAGGLKVVRPLFSSSFGDSYQATG